MKSKLQTIFFLLFNIAVYAQGSFVRVKDHQFILRSKPYHYIATNYYGNALSWYASTNPSILRNEVDAFPIDINATKQTVNLYKNLKKLLDKGIRFGHQDDLAYGVGWKNTCSVKPDSIFCSFQRCTANPFLY